MGCQSCATGACGVPTGCGSNGDCSSGGCSKLNSFDWLGDMDLPSSQRFNIVEIKFKGGRKGYFKNHLHLELYTGDPVVVDTGNGHHIGHVSLQGDLVRLQLIKKGINEEEDELLNILRHATPKDLEKLAMVKNREIPTLYRTREIIQDMELQMKLSDVDFQADNSKATFYYSADDRVDFRQLIKVLASEFKIRVEMRQISLRQEASRLGGIGSCGRELCCSTWLTEFKSVSTSAARYQNLSLNPSKLSGQCGRLKCCLNYELETYIDALVDIPLLDKNLKTQKGEAVLQKVDIFRKRMWFSFQGETTWHAISTKRVHEISKMNERGKFPETLEENTIDKTSVMQEQKLSSVLDKQPVPQKKNKGKRKPDQNKQAPDNKKGQQPSDRQKNQPRKKQNNGPAKKRGNFPNRQKGNNAEQKPNEPKKQNNGPKQQPKSKKEGGTTRKPQRGNFRGKRRRPNNTNE
ncbi:regulatory iron-sulfur-containing complex subunit RicT [Flammeovirga sp. EKP202]|uniref:regulatory iron-sulfur-containing complex subunit RicT n=1 Tax=Flammeovirga sp. EKP202 TaxID=2770592 RepID=UPI00165F7656|nr:regulatory iron-sulfur-containing complex subunit RicT [Flammeovirga sp. EKP202]MBD0402517.1 Signal peptidase-like protein [Flammeovirga sp. EKP202]